MPDNHPILPDPASSSRSGGGRWRAAGRYGIAGVVRLARDRRGNVMLLWVLCMIPLVALMGSGIDLGTAYVARKQMQVACDAAVLAGRRAMTTTIDDRVRSEATKFFNFNFTQGVFGARPFVPQVTSAPDSKTTLVLTAATSIPTSVMRIFGVDSLPVSTSCNASQDFVNTDIVLVLDTTGSMKDKATPADTKTKIEALRGAVLALFDQLASVQDQLSASGMRLRYGVVPYASAVNVGKAIRAVNPDYMLSGEWTYQSRQSVTERRGRNSCYDVGGTYDWAERSCTYFTYLPRKFDVTDYVAGAAVDVDQLVGTADGTGYQPTRSTPRKVSWAGCVEERQTVAMPANSPAIPAGATDLNINLIPTDNATRWKPYWPEVEYVPYWLGIYANDPYKPQYACPSAPAMMKSWTRQDLENYLKTLVPNGGTYHDNGMMWGARWASSSGIFGGLNPEKYNSMPVKKYIIFMTDGLFDTGYRGLYSSYGVEQLDKRATPGGASSDEADQLARHRQRFSLLCSQAKAMGYSVWVLGFATSIDSTLENCASNKSQASTSDDQEALMGRFVEIGKNIGALRLTR
jgi:Flp pilus assembly protein TadG